MLLGLSLALLASASGVGTLSFSVDDDLSLRAAAPVYAEMQQPVLVCTACTLGGLPSSSAALFPSTGVSVVILAEDYQRGMDVLDALPQPRDQAFQNFEYAFDASTGTLRVSWADAALLRPAWQIAAALRTVRFAARGTDPTLRGTSFSRRVRLLVQAADGSTAYPERVQAVGIAGRNEAPLCVPTSNAPPEPSAAVVFTEGSSLRTLLWPAPSALALTDVDDSLLSGAEVFFSQAPAGAGGGGPAVLSEDALACWDPLSDPDPAGFAITPAPYNASAGSLHFSGLATLAQYAAALATVGYLNSNTVNPTLAPRTIYVRVWDASASQPGAPPLPCARPASVNARVLPVNHAPAAAWLSGPAAVQAALGSAVYAWSPRATVALAPFTPPLFGVALSDADDATLNGLTLSVCSGTCQPGEDVLGVNAATVAALQPAPSLSFTARYNASSCVLSVSAGLGATGAPLGDSLATVQRVLLPSLQYINAATGGSVPSAHARSLCLSITDSGVGGAVPPLPSPALNLTITIAYALLAPQLAVLGGANASTVTSGSSVQGRPWVVAGSAGGTPVQGGFVSAWNDNPVGLAAGGAPARQFFFFVTGGTGVNAFGIDPFLGTLFVAFNADLSVTALGRYPTVEVTVRDTMDSTNARPSSSITFPIALVESSRAPALQPGVSTSVPISSTIPAPVLLHGLHSAACVDVALLFSTPLPLLNLTLQWLDVGSGAWLPMHQQGAPSSAAAQSISWLASDPAWWGPSNAPPLAPTVYCLFGTPLVRAPSSAPPGTGVGPTVLHLSLLATPSDPSTLASLPLPLPPLYSVRLLWNVMVNVGGCRDPAAAYSPCMRNGTAVDDTEALDALSRVVLWGLGSSGSTSASPTGVLQCDNFCIDTLGQGVCDNACGSQVWPGAGAAGSSNWSCAANPAGNYNSLANVGLPLPHVAHCTYPPRMFKSSMLWPPLPQALQAYSAVNVPSAQGVLGQAEFSAPFLVQGSAGWGEASTTRPFLTSTSLASPSAGTSGPTLMPEGSLSVHLPPPADSGAAAGQQGAVALDLTLGALDAIAYTWAMSQPSSTRDDAVLSTPSLPRTRLNLSLPVSLTRVSWPADVPLPPLNAAQAGSPAPVLDALSIIRYTPSSGAYFPPTTAPPRLCYTVAPPAPHLLAAWAADPARRRYPRIYAARQRDSSQTPGVLNTSLLHFPTPSAAQFAAAANAAAAATAGAGGAWGRENAYAWLPVSGYSAWEVLPLLTQPPGGERSPAGALWWEAGAFGTAATIVSPTQGGPALGLPSPPAPLPRLCTTLRLLPALTVLGWSTEPPSGVDADASPAAAPAQGVSWELAADVNTDCDDAQVYPALAGRSSVPCGGGSTPPTSPAASSFPRHLTSLGNGMLVFSAFAGSGSGVGRELWAVGERTALGATQAQRDFGAGDCASGGDYNMDSLLCMTSWSASGPGNTLTVAAALALRTPAGTSYLGYPGGFPTSSPPLLPTGAALTAAPLPGPPGSLVADLFSPYARGASSSPAWLTEVEPGSGLLVFSALGPWGRELYLWDTRLVGEGAPTTIPGGDAGANFSQGVGGMDTAPLAAYPAGYRRRLTASLPSAPANARRLLPRHRRLQAAASLAAQEAAMAAAAVGSTPSGVFPFLPSFSLLGPTLVADLAPGSASSNPEWITPLSFWRPPSPMHPRGLLAFSAQSPASAASWAPGAWTGTTLYLWAAVSSWRSEPGGQGPPAPAPPQPFSSLLSSYPDGGLFSDPQDLTVCGGSLFFSASSPAYGRELWRVDYNASATASSLSPSSSWLTVGAWSATRISDIAPGMDSSSPTFLTCIATSLLLFTATTPASGREVWGLNTLAPLGSAGSLTGLPDIAQGSANTASAFPPQVRADGVATSFNPHFTLFDDSVFFAADDGVAGSELWVLRSWPFASSALPGAAPQWPPPPAQLFSDAFPGPQGSAPAFLTPYASRLYFSATLPLVGRELCYLDWASGSTRLAANLDTWGEAQVSAGVAGGTAGSGGAHPLFPLADGSSNPEYLTVFHGRLWFAADDGAGGHGVELIAFQAPGSALDPAPPSATSTASIFADCAQAAAQSLAAVDADAGAQSWVNLGPSTCARIVTPMGGSAPGDAFGASVALDPGTQFGGSARDAGAPADSTFAASASEGALPYWAPLSLTVPWQHGAQGQRPAGQGAEEAALGLAGGRTLAVGAPGAHGGAGLAYIFERQGPSWVQRAVCGVEEEVGGVPDGTVARAGGLGDAFGSAVAATARLVLIGAPHASALLGGSAGGGGRVYAYMRSPTDAGAPSAPASTLFSAASASSWAFQGALPHPAATLPDQCSGCNLGRSVAVFGNSAAAGAPGWGGGAGAAWVWLFSPVTSTWALLQRLLPPSPVATAPPSAYGTSIAMSYGCIAVGAPGEAGGGAIVLWRWDGALGLYVPATLAPSLGLSDALAVQGAAYPPTGSAFTDPSLPPPPASRFGAALSLHGTYLTVSAPGYYPTFAAPPSAAPSVTNGQLPGAVFSFTDTGQLSANARFGSWAMGSAWLAADGPAHSPSMGGGSSAAWGHSIAATTATAGGRPQVLVGAPSATGGSAGLPLAGQALALNHALQPSASLGLQRGGTPSALLGSAVALVGSTAALGAPGGGGAGGGLVYVTACPSACDAAAGQFTLQECSLAHGRVCGLCDTGPCPAGSVEVQGCTATANRVCAAVPRACAGGAGCLGEAGQGDAASVTPQAAEGSSCWQDGLCDEGAFASDIFAPSLGARAQALAASAAHAALHPALPPDAGAPWRAQHALQVAFTLSGGAGGLWWAGDLAAAWAAHIAAGTSVCTGLDAAGHPPPGQPGGAGAPWPGVACDASGAVTHLALPRVGLHGAALDWLKGDAFPSLASVDLSGNPALTVCPERLGGGVACVLGGALPAEFLPPPSLRSLDLSGCAVGEAGGGLAPALLRALPALQDAVL